jgi:formamidopyrimidine-DNA glycosylase
MPELPDITVYVEALRPRVVGRMLARVSVRGPFFVRTFDPPTEVVEGRRVEAVGRLGKRIVLRLDGGLAVVLHLMIAGRLLWKVAGAKAGGRIDLAAFSFGEAGTLIVTEASTQKRAGMWVMRAPEGIRALDPGGLDVLSCDLEAFEAVLLRENRTLKRALTNPRMFDGIGNAYSDEILHAARLSPIKRTGTTTPVERHMLFEACRSTLTRWTDILRREFGLQQDGSGRFPGVGEITAFRPDFAVHGRYKKPCPVCGDPVQRIVHAENEVNYCATCQTGGRVLADRSLSRLLKDDWPRTIEAWEGMAEGRGNSDNHFG